MFKLFKKKQPQLKIFRPELTVSILRQRQEKIIHDLRKTKRINNDLVIRKLEIMFK